MVSLAIVVKGLQPIMGNNNSQCKAIEIKIYSLLGIAKFRKAVLWFERLKHRKDCGQNENYHPQDTSRTTLRRFSGYLIYNSIFHIVSLLLIAIYFIVTRSLIIENTVVDIIMVVVVVFDAYCLMLQRYIYLKFQHHIAKKQQLLFSTRERQITDVIARIENKSAEDIDKEKNFLEELKTKVLSGKTVVLSDDVEETLVNIADALNRAQKRASKYKDETLGDLYRKLPENTMLVSTKQRCVSKLQEIMGFDKKDNVLFGVCIIAENSTINEAYRRIFPHPSLDGMLDTIEVMLIAYSRHQKEMVHQ